jgi:hypothetical protein
MSFVSSGLNNQNKELRELLQKIGKRNKSFTNRVTTAFTPSSKSSDFLNMLERKITLFSATDTTLNNFFRLQRIVGYINNFIQKISSKNDLDLKNRALGIVSHIQKLFLPFSYHILKKSNEKTISESDFLNLIVIQRELKVLYNAAYRNTTKSNIPNIKYKEIEENLKEMERIYSNKFPPKNDVMVYGPPRRIQQPSNNKNNINKLMKELFTIVNNQTNSNSNKEEIRQKIITYSEQIYQEAKETQDITRLKKLVEYLNNLKNLYEKKYKKNMNNINYNNISRKYTEIKLKNN